MINNRKWWLGIVLILTSVIGVIVWATANTEKELSLIGNVLLQLGLILLAGFGSFLQGELSNDRRLKLYARERYRRLYTLAESADEVLKYLREVLTNLSSDEDESSSFLEQSRGKKVAASINAFYFLGGRISQWSKGIEDCLDFWNAFSQDEVGQMHKQFLERNEVK